MVFLRLVTAVKTSSGLKGSGVGGLFSLRALSAPGGMPGRVLLCCGRPWACSADLSSVLRVRRGSEEASDEGDELIMLEKVSDAEDGHSCCLFIQCAPHSGEAITSLLLESQARTIEVYAGEEYLGTSRGEVVCTVQSCSTNEEVTLHKTLLHMESPEPVCKVKLLSLDGHSLVHIRRISVSVVTCPRRRQIFPSMGSGIDLDSVRSMVDDSQLSSGAQQLMSMVQLQQRNPFPFENQLQHFLGKPNLSFYNGLHQADGSASGAATTPLSCKSNLIVSQLAQDLGTGDSISDISARITQGRRDDFKAMVSSFLQTSETKDRSSPNPDLLQFLHSLCGEVKHLRIGEQDCQPQQSPRSRSEKSTVDTELDQTKTYRFLEEVVSKQMSAMEKRLLDHIDNRMNRLQEIMDTRLVLLANLIQSSHLGTGDRLTNGEVHLYSDLRSTY